MGRLRSFDETHVLEPHRLRLLLAEGDPQERVWAAWALGLTAGAGFVSEASARLEREPDPGVRRHLIVVLAGLGEGAAVRVLAASDPDPYVRATAYRYLLQIFGADSIDLVAAAATSDPSEIVREEGVRLLEGRWPAARRGDLISLLGDRSRGVREAATERLAEGRLAPPEMATVAGRAIHDPDADLRNRLLDLVLRSGGIDAVPPALLDLPADRLIEVMDVVHASGARMSWGQLAALATRGLPAVDRRVMEALRSVEEADVVWLARCAARALSWPPARNRTEAQIEWDVEQVAGQARSALVGKVATLGAYRLARDERALFVTLIESLRAREVDLAVDDVGDLDDEEWDPAMMLEDIAEQRRVLEAFVARSEHVPDDRDN